MKTLEEIEDAFVAAVVSAVRGEEKAASYICGEVVAAVVLREKRLDELADKINARKELGK